MKTNIHPEMKDATVTCICGNTFKTKATKEEINVEICSDCHPFYTGAQGKAKKTGNIEKFNRRYGIDDKQKA
ncbi:MAG: 50S ribosomal protein L31 [Mollicutes bacterium]|nr:50S ribosomal protein L31 [Mollicutes bacterium]